MLIYYLEADQWGLSILEADLGFNRNDELVGRYWKHSNLPGFSWFTAHGPTNKSYSHTQQIKVEINIKNFDNIDRFCIIY